MHGLILIPSSPKRANAAKSQRVAGWKLALVRWVGLALLVLVVGVSLSQPSFLHTGQQAFLAFQNRLAGMFALPTPTPVPPTPTPMPRPPLPGSGAVVSIIQSVFGSYSDQAIAVARCESSLNPSAVNPTPVGGSHATGLFQILYPSTWRTTAQASQSPYDANANTQAAYEIFKRDGSSWREWVCQP